ncbi:MAG: N-acetylmuramoyl-L-alanine amidase [Sedimentisphaerales bacterium]|nr:N-acetylmuramoyl-L-alanine amidase [Sedimentisphaerales bacterium]
MGNRIKLIIFAAATTIAVVSCQPSTGPVIEDKIPPGERNISINELAATLGMSISESNHTHVVLKNSANTVMIFTLNGGKLYVNTKPIGEVGPIERKAGQIYVSSSLISRIRSAMRAYAPLPTPVPSPSPRRLSGTVVIDPGHGGKDPGATSVLGYYEKDVNLAVALDVARLLDQRGLRVKMTRTDDYFVELEDRAAIANNLDADLFVSIHADSFPKSSRRGYTIYIAKSASFSSRKAANVIARSMSGTGLNSFGVQTANYHVLTATRGPAVLVELGYLSNRQEAAMLRSSSFQDRLAQAVADGICVYFD